MILLRPSQGIDERLDAIESSARTLSLRSDVRAIVARIVGSAPRGGTALRDGYIASALLAAVARAPSRGYTPSMGGQSVNTSVADVIANGGNCVDRTHALLALLYAAGFEARARWIAQPVELVDVDHVAPEVLLGGRWTWADPMQRPAILGNAPQAPAVALPRQA